MKEHLRPPTKEEFVKRWIEIFTMESCNVKDKEKFEEFLLKIFDKVKKREIEIKGSYIKELEEFLKEAKEFVEILDEQNFKNLLKDFIFAASSYKIED